MDSNTITSVFVAKDCARTDGVDTIDGVLMGDATVQDQFPLEDDGSAAESFYGAGEIIITDECGRSMKAIDFTAAQIKAVDAFKIKQRSYDGTHHYSSAAIKPSKVTSFTITRYAAAVEQAFVIHTIDATLNDTAYILKFRRMNPVGTTNRDNLVGSVVFRSAVAGSTAAAIAAALVDEINTNFNDHITMPLEAYLSSNLPGGGSNSTIVIYTKALPFSPGRQFYQKLDIVVELVNFTATQLDNKAATHVYDGVTYTKATIGCGTYEQVAEMEWLAIGRTGANVDLNTPQYRLPEHAINAQSANTYDIVNLNWENSQGDFSMNVHQSGNVVLALPVENNNTNQALDIIATLNKIFNTAYGLIGSDLTLT